MSRDDIDGTLSRLPAMTSSAVMKFDAGNKSIETAQCLSLCIENYIFDFLNRNKPNYSVAKQY